MVEWIYSAVLLATIPIALMIIKFSGSRLLTFIWGILTIAICAFNLGNANIVFSPYLQLATLVMGALFMFVAATDKS